MAPLDGQKILPLEQVEKYAIETLPLRRCLGNVRGRPQIENRAGNSLQKNKTVRAEMISFSSANGG